MNKIVIMYFLVCSLVSGMELNNQKKFLYSNICNNKDNLWATIVLLQRDVDDLKQKCRTDEYSDENPKFKQVAQDIIAIKGSLSKLKKSLDDLYPYLKIKDDK